MREQVASWEINARVPRPRETEMKFTRLEETGEEFLGPLQDQAQGLELSFSAPPDGRM